KKFLVAMGLVAFAVVGCDDSSSASAGPNDETGVESSSSVEQGSSSSEKAKTSSSDTQSDAKQSSSSEKTGKSSSSVDATSSSSVKLEMSSSVEDSQSCSSETAVNSSSSVNELSSSSVALATPCKTETEDNCEYGELIDDRDGRIYKTVKIGDQWWMAENLDYYDDSNMSLKGKSWCYYDSAYFCKKYGRLYSWVAAIDSAKLANDEDNPLNCGSFRNCSLPDTVYGICPLGWHLPSQMEWGDLYMSVNSQLVAGRALKSQSGWYNNGNGTDAFGFSVLPAGIRGDDGYFYDEGANANFWSATKYDALIAYGLSLYYGSEYAVMLNFKKKHAFSVRCVKD
ncbi:fibrobacter succinogenes major paralogous domain-containing protein, partial [Fibrobacter sp.]|uniref:fibrobacter succinogenes major paralogous domain-containing protein n=1 Tax=Fibrobacter sp. TaxID=35828 RepID=UPI00386F5CF4